MIELLDWAGTILIISASIILSSEYLSTPSRLKAFSLFLGSNILWIPLAILLKTYGFMITQFILFINY